MRSASGQRRTRKEDQDGDSRMGGMEDMEELEEEGEQLPTGTGLEWLPG